MAFSSSSSSSLQGSINVTPLIDVLLVLLIIFMVITPLTPRGLESVVPSPAQSSASNPAPDPLLIEVVAPSAQRGSTSYRFAGKGLDLATLRTALQQARSESESTPVMIAGDPRLDYQAVVEVVSEAQRAGFPIVALLARR